MLPNFVENQPTNTGPMNPPRLPMPLMMPLAPPATPGGNTSAGIDQHGLCIALESSPVTQISP